MKILEKLFNILIISCDPFPSPEIWQSLFWEPIMLHCRKLVETKRDDNEFIGKTGLRKIPLTFVFQPPSGSISKIGRCKGITKS